MKGIVGGYGVNDGMLLALSKYRPNLYAKESQPISQSELMRQGMSAKVTTCEYGVRADELSRLFKTRDARSFLVLISTATRIHHGTRKYADRLLSHDAAATAGIPPSARATQCT